LLGAAELVVELERGFRSDSAAAVRHLDIRAGATSTATGS
jgi:hypothetical protein